MSAVTNVPSSVYTVSDYKKILTQNIKQYDSEGNLVTMTFLDAIDDAEKIAKSLFARAKGICINFLLTQNIKLFTEHSKNYPNEYESLCELIVQANKIVEQLLEMSLNDNSPRPNGAFRSFERKIPKVVNRIQKKANILKSGYCTKSDPWNKKWLLADHIDCIKNTLVNSKKGIARELINKINTMRREAGFFVTDRIEIGMQTTDRVKEAFESHRDYIMHEVLCVSIDFTVSDGTEWDINGEKTKISLLLAEKSQQ